MISQFIIYKFMNIIVDIEFYSLGVLFSPFLGCRLKFGPIGFVYLGNLRDEWIIWISICQK